MNCSNCGTAAEENAVFCQECGHRLPVLESQRESSNGNYQEVKARSFSPHMMPLKSQWENFCKQPVYRKITTGVFLTVEVLALILLLLVGWPVVLLLAGGIYAILKFSAPSSPYVKCLKSLWTVFLRQPVLMKGLSGILITFGAVVLRMLLSLNWPLTLLLLVIACVFWGPILLARIKYSYTPQMLQLPEVATPQRVIDALKSGFNYPDFQGIGYNDAIDGVIIDGRHCSCAIEFFDYGRVSLVLNEIFRHNEKCEAMLETLAIRSCLNKFFNPQAPIDVTKDLRSLYFLQKFWKKAKWLVCLLTILGFLTVGALAFIKPELLPDKLQQFFHYDESNIVRNGYLVDYSKTVTIGDAFNNFFSNPKWTSYTVGDDSDNKYVVFTGACRILGEESKTSNVKMTFKLDGKEFSTHSLEIDGEKDDESLLPLLEDVFKKSS